MRYLSLFSGIGGLDLGLDRAGWTCVGQVEIEPFAIAVLEKHWPNVRRWTDVRSLQATDVLAAVGPVDAIVGGFPCQPWSVAGRKLGTDDPRHLWPEYLRLVAGLRPRWVLGENVPGLLASGADLVLRDLEAQDYACWPVVLGADHVGAPHRRRRVFFVARQLAHSAGPGLEGAVWPQPAGSGARPTGCGVVADADRARPQELRGSLSMEPEQLAPECGGGGWPGWPGWPAHPGRPQHPWEEPRATEPSMGLSADGVPVPLAGWRRGALKGLGNAVVPQVAEVLGRAILEVDDVGEL